MGPSITSRLTLTLLGMALAVLSAGAIHAAPFTHETAGPTAPPAPTAPLTFHKSDVLHPPDFPLAPIPGVGFDVYDYDDNGILTGFVFIPPDPNGAAGPAHVVAVTNVGITWSTKLGAAVVKAVTRHLLWAARRR